MNRYYVLLFFLASLTTVVYATGARDSYDIYFTASLNGNLDGCYCIDNPAAGLVNTGTFLASLTKKNTMLLDLGDRNGYPYDNKLAEYIDAAYKYLGYDISLNGDQDFQELIEDSSINWKNFPDNVILYNSTITVKQSPIIIDGLMIISIIDPNVFRFYSDDNQTKFHVAPPDEYLPGVLTAQDKRIVLLYHGYLDNLKKLLDLIGTEMIPIAFIGHEQSLIEGLVYGKTCIYSPGANGNNVGHIVINKNMQVIQYELLSFFHSDHDLEPVVSQLLKEYREDTSKEKLIK